MLSVSGVWGNNRGMALLITIMVISMLVGLTVQFGKSMRHNFFSSATLGDSQQLYSVAGSGLNIAEALLSSDGESNTYDTLQEPWATLAPESFPGLFTRGELLLEITDLSSRLQVNSLVAAEGKDKDEEQSKNAAINRDILKRLLISGRFDIDDETQAQEIVDSLVDWLDEDDRESDFGAESSYYQSLEPGYDCRNGPVSVIEELLLVKGISRALLFGTKEYPGLAAYLTVHGNDGKININTAPLEVLQALHPLMTDTIAEEMDEYRLYEENQDNLENPGWYTSVPAWPGDIELPTTLIAVDSIYFRVSSSGVFNDMHRQITAIFERDTENRITIVYRKTE